jgi:hypothetical protein
VVTLIFHVNLINFNKKIKFYIMVVPSFALCVFSGSELF